MSLEELRPCRSHPVGLARCCAPRFQFLGCGQRWHAERRWPTRPHSRSCPRLFSNISEFNDFFILKLFFFSLALSVIWDAICCMTLPLPFSRRESDSYGQERHKRTAMHQLQWPRHGDGSMPFHAIPCLAKIGQAPWKYASNHQTCVTFTPCRDKNTTRNETYPQNTQTSTCLHTHPTFHKYLPNCLRAFTNTFSQDFPRL